MCALEIFAFFTLCPALSLLPFPSSPPSSSFCSQRFVLIGFIGVVVLNLVVSKGGGEAGREKEGGREEDMQRQIGRRGKEGGLEGGVT